MVVIIEARVFQPPRLAGGEHAERRAGLHPERLDAFDHCADRVEVAILRSRQAAPMQKRLAPPAFAARASASTVSSAISFSARTPVS